MSIIAWVCYTQIISMKRKINRGLNIEMKAILVVSFLIIISVVTFLFKYSNFNKSISDVTEIPENIKESIKNVKPQKSFRIPILLYHYVEIVKDSGDTIRKSLDIVPYVFDAEVKTLKDAGYTFITVKDLADALDNDNITLPEKSVILTFDDGYRDLYTDVFPILRKYQVKATAYIVPNFLDLPNNLTKWQLKEIAQSNLVEIGAHTMDHTYLKGLPSKRVKYEVEESKRFLEKFLGIPVVSFAYPYGVFDNQTIDVVKETGFKTAVTTVSGVFALDINRFFLYRIRPGGRVGGSLLNLLDSSGTQKN